MEEPLFQALFDEAERRPLSVSELNAEARALLERAFASVWVEGEVVNFSRAGSGHWYFNLNDGDAQIRCVCWKGTNYKIRFTPENGITVRIRGRVTLYEASGSYQLVVESLEPSGEGALRAAYEQIRARLDSEGLFAEELKRPIPFFPRRIGVITSKSGAAFQDILTVMTRRARSVSIVLAPALVQGEGAADSIRRALIALNEFSRALPVAERLDVVIMGRGGGSAEDLWAFNDEGLARAVRASDIPVISAVGHEIDWTISDMVADLRAATPSAAAEMVAAREEDIVKTLSLGAERAHDLIDRRMYDAASRLDLASAGLESSFEGRVRAAKDRFSSVASRFTPAAIQARAAQLGHMADSAFQRADAAVARSMKAREARLERIMAKLNALSPLAVLTRGYSITQTADGAVLRDAAQVKAGDKLKIRLERGKLDAEVCATEV
ncbi:MAG: exodeoxyribonuclease VII large subunit [Pyrinomonadaceae bacterium]|nr:exodeoxyribonuclease VII large subunit [Pyrinomonadaceae bacterium]